jgi:two-component system sensor histidine kinase UhpB
LRSGRELAARLKAAEDLMDALRTQQVDAVVGARGAMLLRLKQAEEDLRNSRNQLRALAANLLSVRDDERLALARELHDECGQALTSLQLGLSWVSRELPQGQLQLREKIGALAATTTSLIRSVKNIAGELRTGALDELGLIESLKSQAREFEGDTGTPCRFTTNTAKAGFDRSASVAVFRIVQAALTNVARHAHASRAIIAVTMRKNDLTVMVMDNGKGITRSAMRSHDSIGIAGMRERALALGGTFTLGRARGKGTVLTVRIPLSRVTGGTASAEVKSGP